ncbi:unnamed protein product [Staurois parvus]|uniref:Uncharacterized protein n=1 Tax=Staurois parvus TaxID=386267 RepID=A0ABN9EZP5_9NEOB|nr:unnamed protein product [Staurois parvus]
MYNIICPDGTLASVMEQSTFAHVANKVSHHSTSEGGTVYTGAD